MSSVGHNEAGKGLRFVVSSRFELEYWRYAVQELIDVGHWITYPRDFRSDEGESYWIPRYAAALELAYLLRKIWDTDRESDRHPPASPLWIAVRRQLLVAIDWHGAINPYRAEKVVNAVPERLPADRPSADRAFFGSLLDELFALGVRHPHPDDHLEEELQFPQAWRLLEGLRAGLELEAASESSPKQPAPGDDAGAKFLIRGPLDAEMVARYGGSELSAAIAAVSQMHRLWSSLFGHWGMNFGRDAADEQLWQTLRHDVLFLLGQRASWLDIRRQANEHLPDQLIEADFLIALDQDIQADFEQRFQATETLLIRQAIADGQWPGARDEGALFTLFDPMLEWMEKTREAAVAHKMRQLGWPGRKHEPTGETVPQRRRTAKKAAQVESPPRLSPERFAAEYWALTDDYARRGDRRPSQADFAVYLTAAGYPMAERTIRAFVKAHRGTGLTWPPARPRATAA